MSFTTLKANRSIKSSFVNSKAKQGDDQAVDEVSVPTPASNALPPFPSGYLDSFILDKLEVKETNNEGKGLFSKVTFSPGSIIAKTRPLVYALSAPYLGAYCSKCCSPPPPSGLKRCPRCRTVWYCNPDCQNGDWGLHKHECAALKRWKEDAPSSGVYVPSDAVRCLGRIAWSLQKEGKDGAWAKQYNLMQSHRTSLPTSSIDTHTHLAHSIVRYIGVSSPAELAPFGISSPGELVDLISRFTTNTFSLTSPTLDPIGACVSPHLAFANHSCVPNAVVVFPRSSETPLKQEPEAHLIALQEIEPGEQIWVSYIDTTLSTVHRQKILQETYNFTCKCTLCYKAVDLDPRESIWCPKSCGGICPQPSDEIDVSRCTGCRAAVHSSDAVVDAIRVGQEALEKATFLRAQDPVRARHLTTNMIPILNSARLTPSSHPLLALNRLHHELLVESFSIEPTQELLDEAIRTAAKHSAGLSKLLPIGHPLRGVSLAELGKLLAVDELSPQTLNSSAPAPFPPSGIDRLKLAHETLVRARDELLIGYGKENGGGQVGKEVREALVRVEEELGVWNQGVRNVLEDSRNSRR